MSSDMTHAYEPQHARIGFVGIGNMGAPMAGRLTDAGWRVTAHDVDAERVRSFVARHGGRAAVSLAQLARESDVVITMLPDGHVVRAVVLGTRPGEDCLADTLAPGTLVVDMSSSSPVGTRALGADLEPRGVALLDAPVSGGVKGAVAGTLAIMIGGEPTLAQRLDPLLAVMGRRFYVGALGAGHAAKVLNNYVSAAGLAAASEAIHIAERFGIAPEVILGVLNASTGRNNSTENKFAQYILNGRYDSGFSLGLMAKDLALAMEVAAACHAPAELGESCLQLWKAAEASVGGASDHTEIARYIKRR
jgi:3-hydroxyisobutyrate dehydrogenase